MSGSTYVVKCSQCSGSWDIEIYDDDFMGLRIDDSEVVCYECEKKAHPEDYYDYQCISCESWFDKPKWGEPLTSVETTRGWVCPKCVSNTLATAIEGGGVSLPLSKNVKHRKPMQEEILRGTLNLSHFNSGA